MTENQPRPWDAVLGGNNPPVSTNTFPQDQQRVPVLNPDGTPATATRVSQARRWLETGKAKAVIDDQGFFLIQLLDQPVKVNNKNENLSVPSTEDASPFGCATLLIVLSGLIWVVYSSVGG